jgi:hypothetical protein
VGGIIGTALGLLAGYYEGWWDRIVMRISDVLFAFPGILLALGVVAILGSSMVNVMVAVSVFSVPAFARLVRGNTLVLKQMTYIEAVRSIGASDWTIIMRHILPGTISSIVVYFTMRMGTSIITAASLSFLGLGAQPPTPEWGAMLNEARADMVTRRTWRCSRAWRSSSPCSPSTCWATAARRARSEDRPRDSSLLHALHSGQPTTLPASATCSRANATPSPTCAGVTVGHLHTGRRRRADRRDGHPAACRRPVPRQGAGGGRGQRLRQERGAGAGGRARRAGDADRADQHLLGRHRGQAQIRQCAAANPETGARLPTVNPLVFECNDGFLNDIQRLAVTEATTCRPSTAHPPISRRARSALGAACRASS